MNSITAVRAAIQTEIERQTRAVAAGERIESWTLEWDDDAGVLRKMRSKETEADYHYFREPDLLPLRLDPARLQALLAGLPELPLERRARFGAQYGLPEYDADLLTSERSLSEYFEAAVAAYAGDPKRLSNWMMNDVLRMIHERGVAAGELRLTPEHLAEIIRLVDAGTVNTPTGKALLEKVQESGRPPQQIVAGEGLAQVSDASQIRAICAEVLAENPEQVASYKSGKTSLIGWFVGQAMRKSGGKADPQRVRALFEELLG